MASLTVFANFRVNDEERFQRLKDSFLSFKDIDAERWVINARGMYKREVLNLLREHLGSKLVAYDLETAHGWFHDTRRMLESISTEYVLLWVEDHINLTQTALYGEILKEMKETQTEYMWYSWWLLGKLPAMYRNIEQKRHKHISTFILDEGALRRIVPDPWFPYIIIMQGIFSTDLFKKVINGYSLLCRWHRKMNPFELEKRPEDTRWLPLRYAIPHYELFASIDDNHQCEGYSLQARGLYPVREVRASSPPHFSRTSSRSRASHMLKLLLSNVFPQKALYYLKKTRHGVLLTLKGE